MSGNFAIKGGGGVGPLMANAILNFHFDFPHPSLSQLHFYNYDLAGPGLVSAASSFQHQKAHAVPDLARQICGPIHIVYCIMY